MVRKLFTAIILIIVLPAAKGQIISADRIEGSPYPVSTTPSELFVINDWGWGESKRFTTITLQGLLAKTGSTMIYNVSGTGYAIWLDDLVTHFGVYTDSTYYNDFEGLIEHFKNDFSGYILCDLKDNSSNVAVSLCGPLNAIAITSDNEDLMTSLGKQMLLDVRGKDENWALNSSYSSQFSKDITCLQNENKCMFLSDYSVFANAFQFFDPDINSQLVDDALGRMNNNRVVMGWGPDEELTVKKISQNSLQLNGADWTENLPVLSNFEADLKQHTHTDSIIDTDHVHTVCFLVSDGDNFNWLLKEFYGEPKAYGSPNRGQVSIGWSISPAMSELAPTVMKYLYGQASNTPEAKDFFIASTSGMGYMNPDLFPDLQASAELTGKFMKKADLNILNVIGTQYRAPDMQKYLEQDGIDAVFFYLYSNYAGLNGAIYIVNNKPVIGARYRLWDGFDNASSLAEKLNNQSTDAYSSDGYSLIAVHAWSFNQYVVDEINACVSQLDSNVIVVSPDEFVKRIKKKFGLPLTSHKEIPAAGFKIYPNPVTGNYINLQGDFHKGDMVDILDLNSRVVLQKRVKNDLVNTIRIDMNKDLANGLYILKIIRDKNKMSAARIILQR